ncbi:NADH-quinone oxidoreductase subunit N [Uniformispora flossi]|uniref:NADH-quinone oxidoreductase subunit N n=1 Tax=Uniformispora flossi TaxID=3390723 RepID=UPI003C305D9C
MTGMNENPAELLPEICLGASALVGLLLGAWLPRRRQWPGAALAVIACTAGLAAAGVAAADTPSTVFGGGYAVDAVSSTVRIVVLGGTLAVVLLGRPWFRADHRETEFYVLVQLAALGALMLGGAHDLLLLAAAYLLASVPVYTLVGFRKDRPGTEAALKYYVVGAALGIFLLTGITVLLAAARGTAYPALAAAFPTAPEGLVAAGAVGVFAGLTFKAGAVPAHFWVPDAVQGSTPPVAALITTLPKIGALAAFYRFAAEPLVPSTVPWPELVAALSVAAMSLGNLAAFFQTDAKRLLAYSSISQVGYLLMPIAVAGRADNAQEALLYYLAAYAVTNLGAFAVVCALPQARTLDDYRGLLRRRPALALSLVVCLLGLVGTPPTAVFLGKLGIFTAAVDGGFAWLAVVAAVNTAASLFYYLRWIRPAVSGRPGPVTAAVDRSAAVLAYVLATASVALGVVGEPVLDALGGALGR